MLSFPAVLRNSKLSDRFAHLHLESEDPPIPSCQYAVKKEPLEGKRWIRRRENAKFTHNPHIALPTTVDFAHPLQLPSSTFPHPLPSYLPRSVLVPPARIPPSLPNTSTAGLFSLSLRGARRNLRARPSSPFLVKAVETHLVTWLQGGTYLNPDQAKDLLHFPGDPVGGREDIREVAREAGRLVWAVKADSPSAYDGGFERYVVHCVARWYGVVSFSKETDGHRLTYLLRPNVTRPDPRVRAGSRILDTPLTTDVSDFHVSDANVTDASDASDADSLAGDLPHSAHSLPDIEESRPSTPASWRDIGASDFAISSEDDSDGGGFAASMESLSLSVHTESDDLVIPVGDTTRASSHLRDGLADGGTEEREENVASSRTRAERDHLRILYPRSASSPSPARGSPHRSSARRLVARRRRKAKNDKKGFAGAIGTDKGTFYDYLFS